MNEKQFEYTPQYEKQKEALITSGAFTSNQITNTINLYRKNKSARNLHGHKITCKKDKKRYSIAVLGTGQDYKILLSEDKIVTFVFVGHHKVYDRINKRC